MSLLYCLGIESTAHTFGASVIAYKKPSKKGKRDASEMNSSAEKKTVLNPKDVSIVSNIRDAFTTTEGGMIPFEVAEHHVSVCDSIIKQALEKAGITITDISLISVSQSPGIGHMLRVGMMCARSLSVVHSIPIIGVNHCIAHLEIGRLLTNAKDPILLYASGANTQIIAYDAGLYRVFGETLDIGIGNFLDQFARFAGLGFPGGPKIGLLAKQYKDRCKKEKIDPVYIELPYTVKGMDVGFGGMLTKLKTLFYEKDEAGNAVYPLDQLCYALEETAYAMLCEVTERAMAHCGKDEVLLGGGVACAPRLQEMCDLMCTDRGGASFVLDNEFNVDNAAMIAWLGIIMHEIGNVTSDVASLAIDPYLRTDDVIVTWRD
ncbi:MAG: tRNA (adenosine(37)-N6)-threonylcarbamoyltransferase complex transferase subunit TsaD [Candidatus Woesearchaeota archaeon]